jgi:hypothetical protein
MTLKALSLTCSVCSQTFVVPLPQLLHQVTAIMTQACLISRGEAEMRICPGCGTLYCPNFKAEALKQMDWIALERKKSAGIVVVPSMPGLKGP